MLGMEHQWKYHGATLGNLETAESPDNQDAGINMLVSTHSSVFNLLNSSAHCSMPNQTPITHHLMLITGMKAFEYLCLMIESLPTNDDKAS